MPFAAPRQPRSLANGWRPKKAKVLGLVGVGTMGTNCLRCLAYHVPLRRDPLHLTPDRDAARFCATLVKGARDSRAGPQGIPSRRSCAAPISRSGGTTSSDVVSREPWLKPGATFISLARRELDPDGWRKLDKVVIDSWEFNMLQREFKRMVESGQFAREDLYAEIHELVSGAKQGREREDERILIHTTGLVSQDVALAHFSIAGRWRKVWAYGCPRRFRQSSC